MTLQIDEQAKYTVKISRIDGNTNIEWNQALAYHRSKFNFKQASKMRAQDLKIANCKNKHSINKY